VVFSIIVQGLTVGHLVQASAKTSSERAAE